MKARALLMSAAFDHRTLSVLYKAFDAAWEQIAQVSQRGEAIESARMKLAEIVLRLAQNGGKHDTQALTDAAVQAMLVEPPRVSPGR
jgi:hypothetical protein